MPIQHPDNYTDYNGYSDCDMTDALTGYTVPAGVAMVCSNVPIRRNIHHYHTDEMHCSGATYYYPAAVIEQVDYCEDCGCLVSAMTVRNRQAHHAPNSVLRRAQMHDDIASSVIWRLPHMRTGAEGETLCPACYALRYVNCYECDNILTRGQDTINELVFVDEYGDCCVHYLCDDCFDNAIDHYDYCETHNIHYSTYADECPICESERPSVIRSYSNNLPITFEHPDERAAVLHMGIEMEYSGMERRECERLAHAIINTLGSNNVWAKEDSTVSVEIVTQPRSLMTLLDYSETICRHAYDHNADTYGAGLHIHIDRAFYGDDADLAHYKLALIFARHYYALFNRTNRESLSTANDWARPMRMENAHTAHECDYPTFDARKAARVASDSLSGDRYFCVNGTNANTLEVRLGGSTIEYEDAENWIRLVHHLACIAKYATIEDIARCTTLDEVTALYDTYRARTTATA